MCRSRCDPALSHFDFAATDPPRACSRSPVRLRADQSGIAADSYGHLRAHAADRSNSLELHAGRRSEKGLDWRGRSLGFSAYAWPRPTRRMHLTSRPKLLGHACLLGRACCPGSRLARSARPLWSRLGAAAYRRMLFAPPKCSGPVHLYLDRKPSWVTQHPLWRGWRSGAWSLCRSAGAPRQPAQDGNARDDRRCRREGNLSKEWRHPRCRPTAARACRAAGGRFM